MAFLLCSLVILSTTVLVLPSNGGAVYPADQQNQDICNLPPELWCDNVDIQKLCNTQQLCAAYNQTVRQKPVNLTVIYETLCPYCQNFTRFILYPKVYQPLKDILNIRMVPYGNAKQTQVNGTWEFTCQNGLPPAAECLGNTIHNCVIYHLPDAKIYMPFIYCMEESLATTCASHCNPQQVAASAAQCYKQGGFTKDTMTQIETCVKGPEGTALMHQAGLVTEGLWPEKHRYTPWFFINNASTAHQQDYQLILDKFICSAFVGAPNATKACG
jgi:interferon gamma-inducible protein 30